MSTFFPTSVQEKLDQASARIFERRVAKARKDQYMPRHEIPYPAHGNYCEITSHIGRTVRRRMFVDGIEMFHQRYIWPEPCRLWFKTDKGITFFWENLGERMLIRAVYPGDHEEKTFVTPGGSGCDRPDLFAEYQQACIPVFARLKSTAQVFLGDPDVASFEGRLRWVQVVTWPSVEEGRANLLAELKARAEVKQRKNEAREHRMTQPPLRRLLGSLYR